MRTNRRSAVPPSTAFRAAAFAVCLAAVAARSSAFARAGSNPAQPASAPSGSAGETPERDPRAVALAEKTLQAMGGAPAFAALRHLEFDWIAEKGGKEAARWHHAWERWEGNYRLEGKGKDGKPLRTEFNVNDRTGRSWAGDVELKGKELDTALERAYGRYINDTYWLLMPAKLLDPGVKLAWEGEAAGSAKTGDAGKVYDVIRVTFDKVGLTPGDTYWAYIARDTSLMERWDFVLEGDTPGDRATFLWTNWTWVGEAPARVRLATAKTAADGSFAIRCEFAGN